MQLFTYHAIKVVTRNTKSDSWRRALFRSFYFCSERHREISCFDADKRVVKHNLKSPCKQLIVSRPVSLSQLVIPVLIVRVQKAFTPYDNNLKFRFDFLPKIWYFYISFIPRSWICQEHLQNKQGLAFAPEAKNVHEGHSWAIHFKTGDIYNTHNKIYNAMFCV